MKMRKGGGGVDGSEGKRKETQGTNDKKKGGKQVKGEREREREKKQRKKTFKRQTGKENVPNFNSEESEQKKRSGQTSMYYSVRA